MSALDIRNRPLSKRGPRCQHKGCNAAGKHDVFIIGRPAGNLCATHAGQWRRWWQEAR